MKWLDLERKSRLFLLLLSVLIIGVYLAFSSIADAGNQEPAPSGVDNQAKGFTRSGSARLVKSPTTDPRGPFLDFIDEESRDLFVVDARGNIRGYFRTVGYESTDAQPFDSSALREIAKQAAISACGDDLGSMQLIESGAVPTTNGEDATACTYEWRHFVEGVPTFKYCRVVLRLDGEVRSIELNKEPIRVSASPQLTAEDAVRAAESALLAKGIPAEAELFIGDFPDYGQRLTWMVVFDSAKKAYVDAVTGEIFATFDSQ